MNRLLIFVFLIILGISCVKVGTDEVAIFRTSELDLSGSISFLDLKRNILEPKQCLRCHSEYATEAGLLTAFTPGKPQESLLYTLLQSGEMPKDAPPLSSNNLEYVRLYILRSSGISIPPVEDDGDKGPKGEISFKELSQRIIVPHCIECHKRWTDFKGVSKKIKIGNAEESPFYTEIAEGSMPEDAAPLSIEDQEFVKRYIDTLKN